MPIYCYKCLSCKENFEVKHSMSFEGQVCVYCQSSNVIKLPSFITSIKTVKKKQVGSVVKDYITKAKEDIKEEKKKMKEKSL